MKLGIILATSIATGAAALLIAGFLGGCSAEVYGPGPAVADVQVGAPIEYYYWGGHYHYWHENHYVVVDHVPADRHWVSVDRQPEHPLVRRENEKPGTHRDYNEREEHEHER